MTRAIWYRHWLEIRFLVTIIGIAVALLCVIHVTVVSLGATAALESHRVAGIAGPIWSSGTVVLLGLLLWGTGVRTGIMAPGHPSLYYTLTLPAARFTLIWTRFAVAAAATAVLFAALLTAGVVALLVTGRGVPLGAMAASAGLAVLVAVALQAVMLLLLLWNEQLAPIVFTAGFLAFMWSLGNVVNDNTTALTYRWALAARSVLAGDAAPWSVAGVLVLIVAASLCLAAVTARRRDF